MHTWTRALMMSAAAVALTFSSCGDKKEEQPKTTQETAVSGSTDTTSAPEVKKDTAKPAISPEKLAQLGFLSQLPADTAIMGAIYEPDVLWQKIRNSAVARAIAESKGLEGDIPVSPEEQTILNILGKEIVFAQYGDVAANAAKMGKGYIEYMEAASKAQLQMLSTMGAGNPPADTVILGLGRLLTSIEPSPTIIAIKNDEASYSVLKAQITSKLPELIEKSEGIISSIEHTLDGVVYTGIKLNGPLLEEKIKKESEGEPEAALLASAFKGKDISVIFGRRGNYTIFFLGKEPGELKFAESPEKSYAYSPDMEFVNKYSQKPANLSVTNKEVVKAFYEVVREMSARNTKDMVTLVDGLLNMGVVTDTDDKVRNALNATAAKMDQLYSYSYDIEPAAIQSYGWWDKGLNIDMIFPAEMTSKTMELTKPLSFASLANLPETIFFYEAYYTPEYYKLTAEVMYELGGFLKAAAEVASESEILLEEMPMLPAFSGPILKAMDALGASFKKAVSDGLGTDGALILSAAAGSEIPVNAALISNVKSKAKMEEASDEIIQTVRNLGTATLGEMWQMAPELAIDKYTAGSEAMNRYSIVPSEMTKGLNPGMLLGDKTMIQGTSVPYIQGLADTIAKSNESAVKGYIFQINVAPLAQMLAPLVNPDMLPILEALNRDVKGIKGESSLEGKNAKATIRFITE